MMSGLTPRVVGGEQLAGAAEAGGDLVEDQQHAVPVADLAQVGQVARIVEPHAARALHHGFDDHRGQLVGVLGQLLLELRDVGGVVRRVGTCGAKTWWARTSVHSECMPPSGSHTLIGVNVSP